MAKGTAIDNFFVALGFDVDDKELKGFIKHLEIARVAALAFGAAALATGTALAAFTVHVAEQLDSLGDYAEAEQVSAEALQELGYAAQLNGSSLESVKSTVSGLNRVMGEAILGIGRGAKIFEKLGLEAKNTDGTVKTFDQILGDVADKMQGLSRQEQIAMAEKLGIDRSLIPLLIKGREAIAAYREEARELGIATQDEIEQAGALADVMDKVKFAMGAVGDKLAAKLMPAVKNAFEGFLKWYRLNREFINQGMDRAVAVITTVCGALFDVLVSVVSIMTTLVRWVIDNKIAMGLLLTVFAALIGMGLVSYVATLVGVVMNLAKALAAVNLQAAIIPVLIGLAVAAIALIVEDIYQWRQGNASVVGDILAQYPSVIAMIDSVASAVNGIGAAYDNVVDKVSRFIELVANSYETVKGLFNLGFGGGASMRLPNLSAPGAPLGAAGSRTSTVNSHQNNTFNIRSTNPQSSASEVNKVMTKQNRNVARNNRTAVVQ